MAEDRDQRPAETTGRDDSVDPTNIPTPPWHQSILDERRRLADEGKLKFQDWETMFEEIREGMKS